MHATVKEWLGKEREELDEIYRNCSSAGNIPTGDTRGTAIIAGSPFRKYSPRSHVCFHGRADDKHASAPHGPRTLCFYYSGSLLRKLLSNSLANCPRPNLATLLHE